MLKKRLIPKLLLKASRSSANGRRVLVTTVQFDKVIEVGDPISQAKIYEAQAADELIFLDLDRSACVSPALLDIVRRTAEQVFMPLTVGGGIKTIDDIRALLAHGADKISLNTAAVAEPELINRAASRFGNQCVVLSIDVRRQVDGSFRVYTGGGRVASDLDPVQWAIEGEKRGAGEILLTSIDRDGTRQGLEIDLIRRITECVSIPVIASGGCGITSHFIDGYIAGCADAVAAGTYFCFKDENPMQARSQIKNAGVPLRLHT